MLSPPVGSTVQFFPCADKSNDPIAAIVVQSSGGGQLKLNLCFPGGGEMVSSGEFVRHIDDPWVKENSQSLMRARNGVQRGAWDSVPGQQLAVDEKVDRRVEGERRVRQMAEDGKDVPEIAKHVRGFGISRGDVEKLIEELVVA